MNYLQKLKAEYPDVAVRYKDKIAVINNTDPFTLTNEDLEYTVEGFPKVSLIDIMSYLVLTHSYYTKEQMKAFKSLESYKYFEAGFVENCGFKYVNENVVVVGKVKHSQKLTSPSLHVWLICSKDGTVQSAHCTCMAGTGEVCSHVGAILFTLENINRSYENISCTDHKATWKAPKVANVQMSRVKKHGLGYTKKKRKFASVPCIEGDELVEMLQEFEKCGDNAALMRICEPFASAIAENHKAEVAPFYQSLYKPEYEKMSLQELQHVSLSLEYSSTSEECKIIEKYTSKQNSCKEWYLHRTGRVTASKFKSVCRTNIHKPSLSLVKSICYPLKTNFKSKATEWGIHNEIKARNRYIEDQVVIHEGFQCATSGLLVSPLFPFIGASPDGLVSCKCCGKGCLEIKCPYLLKSLKISEYVKLKISCLELGNDKIRLKRCHSYYYQVQMQMKISERVYCDFVTWSPNEIFMERIYFSEDFWLSEFPLANKFHNTVILPELLGRYYTRTTGAAEVWCSCKQTDDGRPMIQCENDDCEIKWFHVDCVGMQEIPEYVWFCETCDNTNTII